MMCRKHFNSYRYRTRLDEEVSLKAMKKAVGKALAISALAMSPVLGYNGEIDIDTVPTDIVELYNIHDNIDVKEAQRMADTAFERVGEEAIHGFSTDGRAWNDAKQTYAELVTCDYKIATAFLGKFNVAAKKLFGTQIRPIPKPVVEAYKHICKHRLFG